MAHVPPIEPTDVATKADLASLEERLEVHLTVFVDERLAGTERRLLAAIHRDLAAHSRAVAAAALGAVAVAVVVALLVVR